jgi:hypothetical protein
MKNEQEIERMFNESLGAYRRHEYHNESHDYSIGWIDALEWVLGNEKEDE